MGTIRKGILGGVSGKIGNVVGGSWKGIDYLRTLPASVNDARTPEQVENRSRFITVIRFLQPLVEFIRIGFKSMANRQTAFNAAVSVNYKEALTGSYPDVVMDYPKVVLSHGSLSPAFDAVASSVVAAQAHVAWTDNSGQGSASADDVAMVVVYHPELGEAVYVLDAATRADAALDVDLPQHYSGATVHVYLSFMILGAALGGQAGSSISKSVYAGSITVM